MARPIYITNMSLDGYIEDETGSFDWESGWVGGRACPLKTIITAPGRGSLLLTAGTISPGCFPGSTILEVPVEKAYAANALAVGDRVIVPEGSRRVRALVEDVDTGQPPSPPRGVDHTHAGSHMAEGRVSGVQARLSGGRHQELGASGALAGERHPTPASAGGGECRC